MANKLGKKVAIILVLLAAFAEMLHRTEAEDFTVGDSTGWISNPPGGASFYSNWANNFAFEVNDTLVFNFATGRHVVAILSETDFEECNFTNPIQVLNTGPARVTLNRTGNFYFACAFTGHCISGQKLSIFVTAPSPSPEASSPSPAPPLTASPSPAPSPATSPEGRRPFL